MEKMTLTAQVDPGKFQTMMAKLKIMYATNPRIFDADFIEVQNDLADGFAGSIKPEDLKDLVADGLSITPAVKGQETVTKVGAPKIV